MHSSDMEPAAQFREKASSFVFFEFNKINSRCTDVSVTLSAAEQVGSNRKDPHYGQY